MSFTSLAALAIFVAVYWVMAFGRAPLLRVDRAGAALAGAAFMVALGVLTREEALAAVDVDTIVLLTGMMIVAANLRLAGVFELIGALIAAHVRRPLTLLAAVVVASGVLSAVLVNDTICLVLTPFVVGLTLRLRRDPVPYAIAVATASNVGSVATITGNPQNMIIGSLSGIPYASFAAALAPAAAGGLVLVIVAVALAFRREFFDGARFDGFAADPSAPALHAALVAKSLAVTLAMIAAFFLGFQIATAAIAAGAALLLTRRIKPARVWREIDWPLLVMFAGLFVVTAALKKLALTPDALDRIALLPLDGPLPLTLVTAALSNLVSNVPAVLALEPIVARLADPTRAWLIVAMASTLAGNLTLVGSVANLIVAERARALGVEVGFWPYLKVGAPLTVATLALGLLLV
ncbi:SLC13 family permease [Hansschlegelia sp. KR7-227]|uniref:SLC13 family permease n=1 Tax=Hansschlegelia sp. KR7-227 TaxID=3400914 RepID=UPI003BFB5711